MFGVGVRIPVSNVVAKCSGDECKNLNITMSMGEIYEARIKVVPKSPISPNDIPSKVYAAISAVRKQYPGVIINYISVSDDGSEVIVQMFDQPPRLGFWMIVAVLALILAILIVSYEIAYMIIYGGGATSPRSPLFWAILGAGIALPTFSIAYLVRSFRKK